MPVINLCAMFNSRKFRDLLENVIPLQKAAEKIGDKDINADNGLMLLLIYPFSCVRNKFSNRVRENSLRGFTPLEKAADFNRRSLPLKADGGLKPPSAPLETDFLTGSAQTVREQSSLTGFTLVEVLVVVAISALLTAVAILGLLRVRLTANETTVRAALKRFSTAAELYAAANAGLYPANRRDFDHFAFSVSRGIVLRTGNAGI